MAEICEKHNEEKVISGKRLKCRTCNKEYQKKWFSENREVQQERVTNNTRKHREKIREFLYNFLKEHPCVLCGETDPVVLDFDHLRDKKFGISRTINSSDWYNIEEIKLEMAKCQVLCSNCHRKKTAKEGGHFKYRKSLESI